MKRFTGFLALGALLVGLPAAVHGQVAARQGSPAWLGLAYNVRYEAETGQPRSVLIVRDVWTGSPAERAGIRAGDTVVRVNDLPATPQVLVSASRALAPGDTVRLRVRRNDTERDIPVVAAERPAEAGGRGDHAVFDSESIRQLVRNALESTRAHLDSLRLDTLRIPAFRIEQDDAGVRFRIEGREGIVSVRPDTILLNLEGRQLLLERHMDGLRMHLDTLDLELSPGAVFIGPRGAGMRAVAGAELADLNPDLARSFRGVDTGVLVLRVAPETPAARGGLRAGDVIVAVNGRAVTDVRELRRAVLRDAAEPVHLDVVRDGQRREIRLPIARQESEGRRPGRRVVPSSVGHI